MSPDADLAAHVATLGRGPGRSRSLTRAEAAEAMAAMLSGRAAPEAVGALLMLLRVKGETAEEIAGLADAAQAACPALPRAALDWPSYAAGRTRGLPWFLLSARLVARAGHPVVLHGWNGSDETVRAHLAAAGIPVADAVGTQAALDRAGVVYLPLEALHPALFSLLSLRGVLGLRSCVNTVCRMLNPARAAASVQGVFHPSYRLLQADAAGLLGWRALTVIKGGGGEFERHPGKGVAGFGLRGGAAVDRSYPASLGGGEAVRLADGPRPGTGLAGLWDGTTPDPFAEAVVIGTAELALDTLGVARPGAVARQAWATRLAGTEAAA
ncbi:glycosyl transferase family protein [Roseicyclus persicicus]|uniref:Glycosyl transferase family protein n=1 Tax=Roseicyclus persicicus TaxID=2650661 RepID=A0A7X6H0B8_9RHOB|nr:glycosyl transferase family protein [Roseibacterium persicicum]NKX44452.1 glycosyl transferase family protein [Roseibacterium persicicum]